MTETQPRVTLRDIAKAVGVHFTTVSLALRNDPRLPPATRKKIQSASRSLGYVPDPLLASLSSYRRALRPPRYRGTLAWITNYANPGEWRQWKIFRGFFSGAEEQAQLLGYKLDEFWMRSAGMTRERSSYILRSRGIDGLIIAPQPPAAPTLDLQWERFSAVALGYSLGTPALNVACNHQYHSMKLALRSLLERRYDRVGFVILISSNERVDENWLSGYLIAQRWVSPLNRIPPLLLPTWDEAAIEKWIRDEKPDAIITDRAAVLDVVRRCGLRVSRDIGVAFIGKAELGGPNAGIDEVPAEIGAGAVKMLVDMIRHSERGIPLRPRQLLFEGKWVDGASVRSPAQAKVRSPKQTRGSLRSRRTARNKAH